MEDSPQSTSETSTNFATMEDSPRSTSETSINFASFGIVPKQTQLNILAEPGFTNRIIENNRYFIKKTTEKEKQVYDHLKDLQGICIPKLYGTFGIPKEVYLILENLRQDDSMVDLYKITSEQATEELVDNVLLVLQKIHEKGVIHCDIKPEHIYVSKIDNDEWKVVVIDFDFSFIQKNDDAILRQANTKDCKPIEHYMKGIPNRYYTGVCKGTPRYQAVSSQLGLYPEKSWDYESIGYSFAHALGYQLPWSNGQSTSTVFQLNEMICRLKIFALYTSLHPTEQEHPFQQFMKEMFEVTISDDINILTKYLKLGITQLIQNKNEKSSYKKETSAPTLGDKKRSCDKCFRDVKMQNKHQKRDQPPTDLNAQLLNRDISVYQANAAASVEDLIYKTIKDAGFECEQIPQSSLKIPYFSEFRKQCDFQVDLVGQGTPSEMTRKLKDKSLLLYPFFFRNYDDSTEPCQSDEPNLFCSESAYLPKDELNMDVYASQKFGQLEVAIIFLQCKYSGKLTEVTSGTGKQARTVYQEISDCNLKPHPLELLRQPIWAFLSLYMPNPSDNSIIDNAKQKSYYKLITRPRVRILSYLNRLGVFVFTSRELEETVNTTQQKINVRKSVNLMDISDGITNMRLDMNQLRQELTKLVDSQENKNKREARIGVKIKDKDGDIIPLSVESYADLVEEAAERCGLKTEDILKFEWADKTIVKDDRTLDSTPEGTVLTPILQQTKHL